MVGGKASSAASGKFALRTRVQSELPGRDSAADEKDALLFCCCSSKAAAVAALPFSAQPFPVTVGNGGGWRGGTEAGAVVVLAYVGSLPDFNGSSALAAPRAW